ncbi:MULTISPECIES: 4,5-dihydroxyphthalate decarboxylase [unclassified Streptomyces]|uniref:4,5-dihydroxyphthalate decarboxylase n=1 Tax=unclassified Streptomyces TaxID=2593676 RepID=UPI00081EEAE1|nr:MULTISPECIES: 4,5-dihydroxyphthalate decarboxylase [unclassified Streptomyces]MYZ36009.1 ABC transporter substrate-binding protein [Streptomyces sp. SID4917]SCF80211.1 4,5-dihydroxyphthalate decarboxylase [Streptomyces sp. MnatMP-M17]
MAASQLRTVTRTQGNNEALKTGEVTPRGFRFDFEEVPVLVHAFRRMVRDLEFDVSEMALTTYLVAKAHGVRFTALPVFLVRGFHHGAILHDPASDIRSPKDLEGRRVGVNRGYTVTTGVWARAVLREEYGVDLDRVRWVLSGDEHVAAYRPPANVEPMVGQRSLEERLTDGELAATIGVNAESPRLSPLIADPEEAGFAALRERGFYPINHLVVVRDELLAERPELGAEVFDAFARAKRLYVERLRDGSAESPGAADRMYRRVMDETGADPLPYGIEPNRAVLETLVRHAVDQRILDRPPVMEELFAESTRDLRA